MKFGAQISTPCDVAALDTDGDRLAAVLSDGTRVAQGGDRRYRRPVSDASARRLEELEGAGIYYAATELEARGCAGQPVTVVGGANSAGQAALFLAASDRLVTLASAATTSPPGCLNTSSTGSSPMPGSRCGGDEITRLHGERRARTGRVDPPPDRREETRACSGLFCFIGAEPATGWLTRVAVDRNGFVRTDVQLTPDDLDGTLDRARPIATSVRDERPRGFAAGDVRHGSMKRVATAVGEGASAVSSVHRAIGPPSPLHS